jgi:hypothetical protein
MASIYQSKGPGVQLKGPSVNPGFNAVQASDQSRQMLARAEGEFRRSQSDISALAGFSDKLNEFLNQNVEDKKLKDRDDLDEIKEGKKKKCRSSMNK